MENAKLLLFIDTNNIISAKVILIIRRMSNSRIGMGTTIINTMPIILIKMEISLSSWFDILLSLRIGICL